MMLQAAAQTRMECDIITTEAGVEALAEEWRALYGRAGRSPFSDYDLFMIWWRTIGKTDAGRSLHVVTGRIGGELVGVLPLTVFRRRGLRIMQHAGYRAYNYCDMLATDITQAIELWQAARQSPLYDFADIRDVYPESLCYQALSTFARGRDLTDAYSLNSEWASGKEWLASLPSHTRGNYMRCLRRLAEKGAVEFVVYRNRMPPEEIVSDLVEKKVAWGVARAKTGLFEHPAVLPFFRLMTENAVAQKSLFLGVLKCDGQIIGYNQGFVHHHTLHGVFWTYNPDWSRFSPGNLVLINSVIWAIDQDMKSVDYRQGGSQFKRQHSNHTRYSAEFTFHRTRRGWLVENTYMLVRKLMRIIKGHTGTTMAKED